MHLYVDYFVTRSMLCMAPVGFQLEIFDCPSKNGDCRENGIIIIGFFFHFWKVNDRSCHSEAEQKRCPRL